MTAVVRALASARSSRMRLTDIARATGLSLPTTARLLAAMARERLVEAEGDKTWKLGTELVYMGLSAARQHPMIGLVTPHLVALAQETGDAAYLTVRSGDDSICVFRAVGAHPAQAYTTDIGSRRPLGIGAGGLALLADLAPGEIEAILQRNAPKLAGYRYVTPATLRADIAASYGQGYTYTENHLAGGVHAAGMPLRSPSGPAIAAVSVSAIAERLAEPRRARIIQAIGETVARIVVDLDAAGLAG